jgi:hypothetical protein
MQHVLPACKALLKRDIFRWRDAAFYFKEKFFVMVCSISSLNADASITE